MRTSRHISFGALILTLLIDPSLVKDESVRNSERLATGTPVRGFCPTVTTYRCGSATETVGGKVGAQLAGHGGIGEQSGDQHPRHFLPGDAGQPELVGGGPAPLTQPRMRSSRPWLGGTLEIDGGT